MTYKIIKIDELTLGAHHHLSDEDECYYLMEFKKGEGYSNKDNSLIYNFKKPPSAPTTTQAYYKANAMKSLVALFKATYIPFINLEHVTMVPIPPSKQKSDPLYDDRMTRLLTLSCPAKIGDIRDLIVNKANIRSAHLNNNDRPSLAEIQDNLKIDDAVADDVKGNIILFDDVITSGAHYLACKNILQERYPDARILGMFIARRSLPPPEAIDFDLW